MSQFPILTPDQRLRVFVSSTLQELAPERRAARRAIERLRLAPVMFELGARPHPPRDLYRAYLEQSHIFLGIYWQSYGWVAPGEDVSGLEDEYNLSGKRPKLIYVKSPAPERQERLRELLGRIRGHDQVSYKSFAMARELQRLIEDDLVLLLTERFETTQAAQGEQQAGDTQVVRGTGSAACVLPIPPTPLIGRETELASVHALLTRADVRLVTLSGPGGTGKTRLAIAAAERAAGEFPDGVCFVPLAPVADPALVVPTLAQALGVREPPGSSPIQGIEAHLRGKKLLLVLDNFEQVLSAAPAVSELLTGCPTLKVLVTSRAVLRLSGEQDFPVPPLAVPVPESLPDLASLNQYEAVLLFTERAQAVKPNFEVTSENASAVAEICYRLDGLPLAIELAAARTHLLPPHALLGRLGNALQLLTGGPRDLPDRQRTLRGAIDWSYGLLTPEEQHLFRCLAVFVGGWDLDAAESVCGADIRIDLLEGLESLVDESLVRQREEPGGEPRFTMLQIIREYALEKLTESGELSDVARRHADYFADFAERAESEVRGPGQRVALDRLEEEHGNLRAAMSGMLERGEPAGAIRIAWAIWRFWSIRGFVLEGRRWFERALEHPESIPAATRARGLCGLGCLVYASGEIERTIELMNQVVLLSEEIGDQWLRAYALLMLGYAESDGNNLERATASLRDALRQFRKLGERLGVGVALNRLGYIAAASGDIERAEQLLEEAATLLRAQGSDWDLAVNRNIYAFLFLLRGDYERAEELLRESLQLSVQLRDRWASGYLLVHLALTAAMQGEFERAARLFGAADRLREVASVAIQMSLMHPLLEQQLSATRSALGEEGYARARSEGWAMPLEQAVDYAAENKSLA